MLKDKSDAKSIFPQFHKMVQTQFQAQIQIFRIDKGGNGIFHQSSCVNTSQQNGVAERKNRHLLEVARAIMFTNNVPKFFFWEMF